MIINKAIGSEVTSNIWSCKNYPEGGTGAEFGGVEKWIKKEDIGARTGVIYKRNQRSLHSREFWAWYLLVMSPMGFNQDKESEESTDLIFATWQHPYLEGTLGWRRQRLFPWQLLGGASITSSLACGLHGYHHQRTHPREVQAVAWGQYPSKAFLLEHNCAICTQRLHLSSSSYEAPFQGETILSSAPSKPVPQ